MLDAFIDFAKVFWDNLKHINVIFIQSISGTIINVNPQNILAILTIDIFELYTIFFNVTIL